MDELSEWLKHPVEWQKLRNELSLKLFFGNLTDIDTNIEHIKSLQENSQRVLEICKLTRALMSKKDTAENSSNIPYWLFTINFGEIHAKANLEWAEETIKVLEEIKKAPKL